MLGWWPPGGRDPFLASGSNHRTLVSKTGVGVNPRTQHCLELSHHNLDGPGVQIHFLSLPSGLSDGWSVGLASSPSETQLSIGFGGEGAAVRILNLLVRWTC